MGCFFPEWTSQSKIPRYVVLEMLIWISEILVIADGFVYKLAHFVQLAVAFVVICHIYVFLEVHWRVLLKIFSSYRCLIIVLSNCTIVILDLYNMLHSHADDKNTYDNSNVTWIEYLCFDLFLLHCTLLMLVSDSILYMTKLTRILFPTVVIVSNLCVFIMIYHCDEIVTFSNSNYCVSLPSVSLIGVENGELYIIDVESVCIINIIIYSLNILYHVCFNDFQSEKFILLQNRVFRKDVFIPKYV